MVQLMKSETNSLKRVKLELAVSGEELGTVPKRPKLNSSHEGNLNDDSVPVPPTSFYPLDEPSPLGLRLRKSPSLLDLIQMRLSKEDNSRVEIVNNECPKGSKALGALDAKIKASNFPASILRIGTWEYKSRYEGDLVAKCYFAKHKLVWEVLDGCLKSKIEIPWSDIMALKANYPEEGPGTLDIVLARRPLFFKEINPQPRKHTLWQTTSDFTGGQASIHRQHFLQCPQGFLGKHFEKLIQCDHRLNFLSQQPNMVLDCPYFEPTTGYGFDRKSEEQAGFLGLQNVESGSEVQSSSSVNEHNLLGMAVENDSLDSSPSSVKDTHATQEFWSKGANTSKFLSNLNQIKVPGLQPSISMTDLLSQIEQYISEQMTSSYSTFDSDNQNGRSVLKEITQYLFSDSQHTTAPDKQFLMSRVNSLCCLLQRDPSTTQDTNNKINEGLNTNRVRKVAEMNCTLVSPSISSEFVLKGQQSDASGSKQGNGISRKESVGELLLNLPRIASLPEFLFHVSEDSGNQVR